MIKTGKKMKNDEFLRSQIDRDNNQSFFNLLYHDAFFDEKQLKKIIKICQKYEIKDTNLKAKVADIMHFTTFLIACHRDKNDVYKIKNYEKIDKKFTDYFQDMREIITKFIKENQ